jgi:REP element-mobilizing transposase RayT
MKDWQSQAHVKRDRNYHVVILPKYRRKVIVGSPGPHLPACISATITHIKA